VNDKTRLRLYPYSCLWILCQSDCDFPFMSSSTWKLVSTGIIATYKGGRFEHGFKDPRYIRWPTCLPMPTVCGLTAFLITLYIHLHILLPIPICLTFSLIFIRIICSSPISIPLSPLLFPLSSFNPFLCYFHLVHFF